MSGKFSDFRALRGADVGSVWVYDAIKPLSSWRPVVPRIRTIKPEFWTDEKTGTLTPLSKCLFLGLLGEADDYGVLRWSPAEWRAKIFPHDYDTTTVVVQKALEDEILPRRLLVRFTVEDDDGEVMDYAFIRSFPRHQVVNNPSRPLLPDWEKGDKPSTYAQRVGAKITVSAGSDPVPVPEDYGSPTSWKGKERKGKEGRTTLSKPNGSDESDGPPTGPPAEPPNDRFDEFWTAYPRKEGKKKAHTAWRHLSQTKRAAAIADCATRYQAVEKQFIPLPTTYLHGERWNDDPIPAKTYEFSQPQQPTGKIGRAMAALNQGGKTS